MKTWRPKGWIFAGVDRCSPPVDSIRRRTSRSDASRFGQNDHGVAKEFATAYTFGTLSLMKRLFIFKVGQQKQFFSEAILKVMAVIWGFFTRWKGDSATLRIAGFQVPQSLVSNELHQGGQRLKEAETASRASQACILTLSVSFCWIDFSSHFSLLETHFRFDQFPDDSLIFSWLGRTFPDRISCQVVKVTNLRFWLTNMSPSIAFEVNYDIAISSFLRS